MQQGETDEQPDRNKVPVARELVSAEESRQPGQLHRLVDGESAESGNGAEDHDESVGAFLECVVLALCWMILPKLQVIQLHLEGRTQVSRSKHQASPLSRNGKERQIYEAGDDK